jgi:hypothetical protein
VEPEDLSPYPQRLVTCPYTDPDQSRAFLPITPFEEAFWCYSHIYAWVFQAAFFPQVSAPLPCVKLSSPSTCHIPHYFHSFLCDRPDNILWVALSLRLAWEILVFLTSTFIMIVLSLRFRLFVCSQRNGENVRGLLWCLIMWPKLFSGPGSSVGIATHCGRTVQGSNPGEGEILRKSPDRPWGPPSLLYNGYRVFPMGKAAGAWR